MNHGDVQQVEEMMWVKDPREEANPKSLDPRSREEGLFCSKYGSKGTQRYSLLCRSNY